MAEEYSAVPKLILVASGRSLVQSWGRSVKKLPGMAGSLSGKEMFQARSMGTVSPTEAV